MDFPHLGETRWYPWLGRCRKPMAKVRCPAVLIAASASGQGKTKTACALARLHTRAGRRVCVFKCGADFLDPCCLANGYPVGAECGGTMVLFDELTEINSRTFMWCVLPGTVTLQKRLAALGLQPLELDRHMPCGHNFHNLTCVTTLAVIKRTQPASGRKLRAVGEALYVSRSVKASYFHACSASDPLAAAGLFLTDSNA